MVNIISCMSMFVFEEMIYIGTLVRLLYMILQYNMHSDCALLLLL